MKKEVVAVVCSLALLVAAGACKPKPKEPAPAVPGQQQLPPGHPQPGAPGAPGGNVMMPKGETVVNVPDSVKGKWKAVVLAVEDKKTKKTTDYTVNLNSDLKIPNSNLKVVVGDFLPDFKMDGLNITSMSNEPNNPAVRVKVMEGDKEIFKGWLYQKFPTIHPFEHQQFGLAMKSAVKKG
ncbi:MAG: DUF2155 domain-containing protein [Nitrospiraceae bacterium]|nr:DUF2155 domain-containing protein [Nitrospiraceae bacterium]